MEQMEKFNWWYLMIPLIIGGPFFFAPIAVLVAIAVMGIFLIVVPATCIRVGWKIFKWAWSR